MKLKDSLRFVCTRLSEAGIDQSSIEGELLLRQALGLGPIALHLAYNKDLSFNEEAIIRQLMQRRLHGEPSAYITEWCEFYGLEFYVNRSVLIPRPETELLVEEAMYLSVKYIQPVIVDVGTGSGAVAISLSKLVPEPIIYGLDLSYAALDVAKTNAVRHGVDKRISFRQGNLLEPMPEKADIIIANLPYVPSDEIGNVYEPRLALDGGETGLEVITQLIGQLPGRLNSGGSTLLEVGIGQAKAVAGMFGTVLKNATIRVSQDLAGIDRMVCATLP